MATEQAKTGATPAEGAKPEKDMERINKAHQLLLTVGEECVSSDELLKLLTNKPTRPNCYDGFEPSGRLHIAQGLFKAANVNKCTEAGCDFTFWVADWFALMNDKMSGELERIRVVGRYLIEVWRACGMDMEHVKFLWSSEEINRHYAEYWKRVIDIGRRNTLARVKKCGQIMGRAETGLTAAQILYPLMQCCDIFFLKADICQLGLDQRKVNMLAREYCGDIGRKLKPIILSHHMMAGLKKGQAKMSKSDPDSAIFMEDSAEEVRRKILQAYCPKQPTEVEDINPCLDYLQCIVFGNPKTANAFVVEGVSYASCEEVEAAFRTDKISEEQLKEALIAALNDLIEPVRVHFTNDKEAAALLELVKSYRASPAQPAAGEKEPENKPAQSAEPHVVSWVGATLKLNLGEALDLVARLNVHAAAGSRVTVVVMDYTSLAEGELTGEEKDQAVLLQYNTALLQSLGLDSKVSFVSQTTLMDPSPNDYWLRVVDAGRKCTVDQVETAMGRPAAHAGVIVSALLHTADVTTLRPTHIVSPPSRGALSELALAYNERIGGAPVTHEVAAPVFPRLSKPAEAGSATVAAPALVEEDVLYVDDNDMELRKKIKQAFCVEGDGSTDTNPVLRLAACLIEAAGSAGITVKRSEANGGDLVFTDSKVLAEAFGSKQLHPADLKPAVATELLERTKGPRAAISGGLKKQLQSVKLIEKKCLKKKK